VSRLSAAFAKGRPALVCFVTGGDPTPAATPAILDALVEGGADVIELGMPFTDPMADGPAIQRANLRALGAGTRTADIFAIANGFRARHPDVPLVLMGYANPMLHRGAAWFASQYVTRLNTVAARSDQNSSGVNVRSAFHTAL